MLDWRSRIYPELTRLNQTNGRVFIWVLSGFLYRVASCVALNLSEGAGGKGREDEKKNNETSGENTRSNRLFSSTPSSRVETLLSARNSKKTKGRLEKSQSISKGDAKLRYDREIQRRPNQKHRRVRICFYLSIFLPFFLVAQYLSNLFAYFPSVSRTSVCFQYLFRHFRWLHYDESRQNIRSRRTDRAGSIFSSIFRVPSEVELGNGQPPYGRIYD